MKGILTILALLIATTNLAATDIWVDTLTDDFDTSNGNCDLREAIIAAENNIPIDACPAGSSDDTIYIKATGFMNLFTVLPSIETKVSIIGPGADKLTIDCNVSGTIFDIRSNFSGVSEISGMTLKDGFPRGIYYESTSSSLVQLKDMVIKENLGFADGAGVYIEAGNMSFDRVTISGNEGAKGGGVYLEAGANLEIRNSTISDNEATDDGGGIYSLGALSVYSTTISGNTTEGNGGGVYVSGFASNTATIENSTITGNTCGLDSIGGSGGGLVLFDVADLTIKNTVLAGNFDNSGSAFPDFARSVEFISISNQGTNFVGIVSAGTIWPFGSGDIVGTSMNPKDPELAPLADNGGPTETHLPLTGSQLIGNGFCSSTEFDQRGFALDASTPLRAISDCDMGSIQTGASEIWHSTSISMMLDGPFNSTSMLMNTILSATSLIPLTQTYSGAPWNYGDASGPEKFSIQPADMVDWVLVEFIPGALLDPNFGVDKIRRVFWLDREGNLDNSEAWDPLLVEKPGHYYVVVQHRNHLPVMSAKPIEMVWGSTSSHNFISDPSETYTDGAAALRMRAPSIYTMWAGDGNLDDAITSFDFLNVWLPANGGPASYTLADYNMDSAVTAFDFLNAWLPANGQQSQLP